MRVETVTRNLYSFDELSEKAKQAAISRLYDINVDDEWWDTVYEDASCVGIKITSFDLGRSWKITGECSIDVIAMLRKIIKDHGPDCRTYKSAKSWLNEWKKAKKDVDGWDDFKDEALRDILDDYLYFLLDEYEYLTSEESIVETIEANEYEFTEDGRLA